MAMQEFGRTNDFIVQFDDVVPSAQQRAQAVAATCQTDLFRIASYMPISTGGLGDPFHDSNDTIAPQRVIIQVVDQPASLNPKQWPQRGGANNTRHMPGSVSYLRINPLSPSGAPITDDFARFLFVAEMAEQIMGFYGWDSGSSQGEALSRIFAELLYPAAAYDAASSSSVAPWVNTWLNVAPRPLAAGTLAGPDFVSANEPTDTNQISFGCGMLFINYLCSQLKFSLSAVCGAGGLTLADRYRNLTGRTDDPLTAMNNLLFKHFSLTSAINLLNNNPFPLFDAPDRKVFFAFKRTAAAHPAPQTGIAHVKPFFTCPAKDYRYSAIGVTVQWTITATAIGFAQPRFQWRINDSLLPSLSGSVSPNTNFDIPNPGGPTPPKASSGPAPFDFADQDVFTRGDFSNVLTLRNDAFGGNYHVKVEVDVTEGVDASGQATSSNASLDFNALFFQYEPQYYLDEQSCEDAFVKAVSHLPKLEKLIDIVHTLPDPPFGPRISEVIEAIDEIRAEVANLAESNSHQARQVAEYIGNRLQIAPGVILKGTKNISG